MQKIREHRVDIHFQRSLVVVVVGVFLSVTSLSSLKKKCNEIQLAYRVLFISLYFGASHLAMATDREFREW